MLLNSGLIELLLILEPRGHFCHIQSISLHSLGAIHTLSYLAPPYGLPRYLILDDGELPSTAFIEECYLSPLHNCRWLGHEDQGVPSYIRVHLCLGELVLMILDCSHHSLIVFIWDCKEITPVDRGLRLLCVFRRHTGSLGVELLKRVNVRVLLDLDRG